MINEYFISKRIEISSEIAGGDSSFMDIGFESTMGYSKIIEELNEMNFEGVYSIMDGLIKMGGLNKSFAEYIIFSEILNKNKFYEIDDMFNITENNLKNITTSEYSKLDKEIKDLSKSILNQEGAEDIYNKYIKENAPAKLDEIPDNIKSFLNKEYNYKFSKFKEDLDVNIFLWLKNNIKKMSDEDYGMFLYLITKIKENE